MYVIFKHFSRTTRLETWTLPLKWLRSSWTSLRCLMLKVKSCPWPFLDFTLPHDDVIGLVYRSLHICSHHIFSPSSRYCEHTQTWREGHHDLCVLLLPRLRWSRTGGVLEALTCDSDTSETSIDWILSTTLFSGWDRCQPYLQSAGCEPREWEADGGIWEAGQWGTITLYYLFCRTFRDKKLPINILNAIWMYCRPLKPTLFLWHSCWSGSAAPSRGWRTAWQSRPCVPCSRSWRISVTIAASTSRPVCRRSASWRSTLTLCRPSWGWATGPPSCPPRARWCRWGVRSQLLHVHSHKCH